MAEEQPDWQLFAMQIEHYCVYTVQAATVRITARKYCEMRPELFPQNPANAWMGMALRLSEEQCIVHVAGALQGDEHVAAHFPRLLPNLKRHRHVISHPWTVVWDRPWMQEFYDSGRQYTDIKPALVWHLWESVSTEAGRSLTRPQPTEGMVAALRSMLVFAAHDLDAVPNDAHLRGGLHMGGEEYLDFLVRHPYGVVPETQS